MRSNHSNDNRHLMIESVQPDAQHHRSSHSSVALDGAERWSRGLDGIGGERLAEGRRAVGSVAHVLVSAGTTIKDAGGPSNR